ncbi:MAG: sulfotransferase family protein [Nocardioidaceae bacterium]
MPTLPDTGTTEAGAAGAAQRKVVLVCGSGRSGTSTVVGILQKLGMHVPQPEVVPDQTNPKGFGEPRWVVDFHNELLRRLVVEVSDARPQAWFETARMSAREPVRERARSWLASELDGPDDVIIKDPRLSWFLGLWDVAALRCDASARYLTMLRPPAEVVASKERAYAGPAPTANRTAAWINMMLHTERATRSGRRTFVRYHDLLDDWTSSVFRIGDSLGLDVVRTAPVHNVGTVHSFVDPSLRRVRSSWDDVELPASVRDLAEQTWGELTKLAEPDGDVPTVHVALDALREEYVALYQQAEAITTSSAIAARRAGARKARLDLQRAAAEPRSNTDHPAEPSRGLKALVPQRLRAMPGRWRRT